MLKKQITLITGLLFFLLIPSLEAQKDFAGIISFVKVDQKDTSYYKYYVKGDFVRIEDREKNGHVNGVMLINLNSGLIDILVGEQKMFFEILPSKKNKEITSTLVKTKEKSTIAGMSCKLWKVSSDSTDSHFEFWVNKGNYRFFTRMLNILNRKEYIARIWISLGEEYDSFPFVGSEYSKSRELISQFKVMDIEYGELDDDLFLIPEDYFKMER